MILRFVRSSTIVYFSSSWQNNLRESPPSSNASMNLATERNLITEALINNALCVRDRYFENRETRERVCAQCIHEDPEASFSDHCFVSRHSVIAYWPRELIFTECSYCCKLLSTVKHLHTHPCLSCNQVLSDFLFSRNQTELREIIRSSSPTVVALESRRYSEFP